MSADSTFSYAPCLLVISRIKINVKSQPFKSSSKHIFGIMLSRNVASSLKLNPDSVWVNPASVAVVMLCKQEQWSEKKPDFLMTTGFWKVSQLYYCRTELHEHWMLKLECWGFSLPLLTSRLHRLLRHYCGVWKKVDNYFEWHTMICFPIWSTDIWKV